MGKMIGMWTLGVKKVGWGKTGGFDYGGSGKNTEKVWFGNRYAGITPPFFPLLKGYNIILCTISQNYFFLFLLSFLK